MRQISEDGLALIRRCESFQPKPYLCPAGWWTVGYGHVIRKGEDFSAGIDEDRASHLLADDLAVAERAVLRLIRVPLSEGQYAALVSFTFNLGAGALQRSTLRQKLNRSDYDAVPAEFLKWVWGGGRKLKGLVVRRQAEANLFSG